MSGIRLDEYFKAYHLVGRGQIYFGVVIVILGIVAHNRAAVAQEGIADVNSTAETRHLDYIVGVHDLPDTYAFKARGEVNIQKKVDSGFHEVNYSVTHLSLISRSSHFKYHGRCWYLDGQSRLAPPWEESIESKEGKFRRTGGTVLTSTPSIRQDDDEKLQHLFPSFEPFFLPFAYLGDFLRSNVDAYYGERFVTRHSLLFAKYNTHGNLAAIFENRSKPKSSEPTPVGVCEILFGRDRSHFPVKVVRRSAKIAGDVELNLLEEYPVHAISEASWKQFTHQGKTFFLPIRVTQHYEGSSVYELDLFFQYSFKPDPKTDLPKDSDVNWRDSVSRFFDDSLDPVFDRKLHGAGE